MNFPPNDDDDLLKMRTLPFSGRFPGKAGEEVKRLEERETELMDELEKQKSTIKKLKEDRTHYRKLADEYRFQRESMNRNYIQFFYRLDLGYLKSCICFLGTTFTIIRLLVYIRPA